MNYSFFHYLICKVSSLNKVGSFHTYNDSLRVTRVKS